MVVANTSTRVAWRSVVAVGIVVWVVVICMPPTGIEGELNRQTGPPRMKTSDVFPNQPTRAVVEQTVQPSPGSEFLVCRFVTDYQEAFPACATESTGIQPNLPGRFDFSDMAQSLLSHRAGHRLLWADGYDEMQDDSRPRGSAL